MDSFYSKPEKLTSQYEEVQEKTTKAQILTHVLAAIASEQMHSLLDSTEISPWISSISFKMLTFFAKC